MSEPPPGSPRGVWSLWPAFAGVAMHLGLRLVLDPWLNASDDTKFWGGVTILGLPLLFSVYAVFRAIVPPQRP